MTSRSSTSRTTTLRTSASAAQAITNAADQIERGNADVIIAGGVESLSDIPVLHSRRFSRTLADASKARSLGGRLAAFGKVRPRDLIPVTPAIAEPSTGQSMGQSAEKMAKENGISREAQDRLALMSHQRAAAATADGRMTAEIIPWFGGRGMDEVATTDNDAIRRLKGAPYERLGDVATLDHHRTLRVGMPEVVLAESKTAAQVAAIAKKLAAKGPLLVTRLAPEKAGPARRAVRGSTYDPVSRTLRKGRMDLPVRGPVAVCCAGTSDIPVCEEAAVTLDVMGIEVIRIYDVGVAGLHRVLARREDLERARAIVVAAGMEGALPSVVGGLVGRPVIGVPTSVGYGASLGGLAPLFTMLNSCAPNVTVVNVDNGFGAAFVAGLIARE
jgi:NCAIR mutase (PurE)-related protein